jgi:hypothetical protein
MIQQTSFRCFSVALTFAIFFPLAPVLLHAQTHEIRQEAHNAYGWFGGDDRPDSQRNVGVGQSVRIDKSMIAEEFSFHFDAIFDYIHNPAQMGHEVTLVLNVRQEDGTILKTSSVVLPSTFSPGWVTWTDLNQHLMSGKLYFFTVYLSGGYDVNQYTSSHSASSDAPYADGERFVKTGNSDSEMEEWTGWTPHPWDSAFRLKGTLSTTSVENISPTESNLLYLAQNYPNPVRDHASFEYRLSRPAFVTLEIYSMPGVRLRTLVNAEMEAGTHRVHWTDNNLPSGMYTLVLRSGSVSASRVLTILR